MSSSLWDFVEIGVGAVGPGGVLVVKQRWRRQPCRTPTQRLASDRSALWCESPRCSVLVVEHACAGAPAERAERALVERVGESTVAYEPGQHDRSVT